MSENIRQDGFFFRPCEIILGDSDRVIFNCIQIIINIHTSRNEFDSNMSNLDHIS